MTLNKAIPRMLVMAFIAALISLAALPAFAHAAEEYDVWVGDHQFTSEKLVVECEAGYASYDPDENSLTLVNVALGDREEYAPAISSLNARDFTIYTYGRRNVINCNGGIYSEGTLKIEGPAPLCINSPSVCPIYVNNGDYIQYGNVQLAVTSPTSRSGALETPNGSVSLVYGDLFIETSLIGIVSGTGLFSYDKEVYSCVWYDAQGPLMASNLHFAMNHVYRNGVCIECGYECAHVDADNGDSTVMIGCDADEHYEYCTICDMKWNREDHTFDQYGACGCNFEKGAHSVVCGSAWYEDLSTTAWYHVPVDYCIENFYITGYDDDKLRLWGPNDVMTREMLATILWRHAGEITLADDTSFEDVPSGKWYSDAIAWCKHSGIFGGYGDGSEFGLGDALTREQMVAVFYRYADYLNRNLSVGEDTNILSYPDAFDISNFAFEPMQWAIGEGIIKGVNNGELIAPQDTTTRAEVATVLYRFDSLSH